MIQITWALALSERRRNLEVDIKNFNPLIEFQEFDTGHGIRSEMPNEYYDLVNKMLND